MFGRGSRGSCTRAALAGAGAGNCIGSSFSIALSANPNQQMEGSDRYANSPAWLLISGNWYASVTGRPSIAIMLSAIADPIPPPCPYTHLVRITATRNRPRVTHLTQVVISPRTAIEVRKMTVPHTTVMRPYLDV